MKKLIRIISLVPSQTELLVDLGLEENIVGITKFCVHPTSLKKNKTIVGGTKNIKLDKIKELQPDFILCNKEENTKEIVLECERISKVHVSNIVTIQDTLALIELYGKLFSCEENTSQLTRKINLKLTDFNQFIKNKPTLKVAYFIWKKPWMVAGNETFINHILQLNKFENIFKNKNRYPEIELENIKNKDLDLVLLSSEPYPFKNKDIAEIAKINSEAKIILVDGEYFSWYGSRLLKAFDYFKELRNSIKNLIIHFYLTIIL